MTTFEKRPDNASEDWLGETELNTVEIIDDKGRIVKKSPIRRFISAGDPVLIYKVEKGLFYWENGGEPIPEWEIAGRFKHIPLDEDKLQASIKKKNDEQEAAKALAQKKENEEKLAEEMKNATVVYSEDIERQEFEDVPAFLFQIRVHSGRFILLRPAPIATIEGSSRLLQDSEPV